MGESVSASEPFRASVLIPVYNHEAAIGNTLARVLARDCPVLLVDDGSTEACARVLRELSAAHADRVELLRLDQNGGKGAAVKAGLYALRDSGYSHAVQLDADGQHDIDDLPVFLDAAREQPDSLVTGYPEYDAAVPRIRYFGRYLTHSMVWINTLSTTIRDSMCGFRVYPVKAVVQLIDEEPCGNRMDFDPELIVRWFWRGGRVVNLPTRVLYPEDGVSHFKLLIDNLLISAMHTRLFFGMLWRLPSLLGRDRHG